MKFGVLHYSYDNSPLLPVQLRERGAYDINLGDNMQTLAVRALYRKLGVPAEDVIELDRDRLPAYDGPPVILVMNACFMARCFPLPPQIIPVFIGFQAKAPVIAANLEMLRRHQPIGCRDPRTAAILNGHGIAAHVTGCLTLTFDPRPAAPTMPKVLVVYGALAGRFPADALSGMPVSLLHEAEFVCQRRTMLRFPMASEDLADAERHAASLLEDYRMRATLVVTSLHHVAAPCIASGIPVVLCRGADDPRFGFLKTMLPLYLPRDFAGIDWAPRPVDIGPLRRMLTDSVRAGLIAAAHMAGSAGHDVIQRLSSPDLPLK